MNGGQLTPLQMRARAFAYQEAADHLEAEWTRIPNERAEGLKIARRLNLLAQIWHDRATLAGAPPTEDEP